MLTWPGGANYLPAAMHRAGPYDVVVGHVARCPIYVDLRQLKLFRGRYMRIDVNDRAHPPGRPLLQTSHHPHAGDRAGTRAGPDNQTSPLDTRARTESQEGSCLTKPNIGMSKLLTEIVSSPRRR